MKVKFKKLHPLAVIPTYAKSGDAGMDLTAVSRIYDNFGNVSYGTGIAIEIPIGFVGLLFPRSSNCKKDLILSNSVGILDSGYRGEITFKFKPSVCLFDFGSNPTKNTELTEQNFIGTPAIESFDHYQIGERIGQILISPYTQIEFEEVSELTTTERGEGGYGSTGR